MLMHEKTCVIPIVVYRFYCMALYHSKTLRHVIKIINHINLKLFKFCRPAAGVKIRIFYVQNVEKFDPSHMYRSQR